MDAMNFSFVATLPETQPEPSEDRVGEDKGCPECHEDRIDFLSIDDDDRVTCQSCGLAYDLTGFDADIDLSLVTISVRATSRFGYQAPAALISASFDANPRLLSAIAHRIASEAEVLTAPHEDWLVRVEDGAVLLELVAGTASEQERGLRLLERAVAKVMR